MKLNDIFEIENEKPLDRLVSDGGYTAIFRTICCIGDSLSSGEFEAKHSDGKTTYHDMYEYSWGQFLARMCGSTVYNFSRGGMTACEYCESFADANRMWDNKYASQAYIIALGVNDLHSDIEFGETSDIDLNNWRGNKKTFVGYYARIIARIKEIQPRAHIFLMTLAKTDKPDKNAERHRAFLYELAKMFKNTHVIDIMEYGPVYDREFRKRFYLNGHLNPMGYMLTAQIVASYIDYIIRHSMQEFREVGFIGTDLHG